MNSDTPAREIRQKDREKNTAAFRECLWSLYRGRGWRARNVLDIRYGLGGWASALAEVSPPDYLLGFEADRDTWQEAVKPAKTTLVNERFTPERAMKHAVRSPIELVLADFNNLTMMKAGPLTEVLDFARPAAVIFTDVACSKLHLNFNSYGLKRPDLFDYVERFRDVVLPGWNRVCIARHHHHASTLAFRNREV